VLFSNQPQNKHFFFEPRNFLARNLRLDGKKVHFVFICSVFIRTFAPLFENSKVQFGDSSAQIT